MPILVESPDGWKFTVERVEDVVNLRRSLTSTNGTRPAHPSQLSTLTEVPLMLPEQAFPLAFNSLDKRSKKFVLGVLKYPSGVEATKLAQETSEKVDSLGGLLATVSKAFKKRGITPVSEVVISEIKTEESRKFRLFTAGVMLRRYADKISAQVSGGGS